MNSSSLAGHAVELIDRIFKSASPADKIVSDFYREKRYLGSHDRRWISEKVYGVVRNFILLRELNSVCFRDSKAFGLFISYEIYFAQVQPAEIASAYADLFSTYKLTGVDVDLLTLSDCLRHEASRIKTLPHADSILNSFPDFFCDLLNDDVSAECLPLMKSLNGEAGFDFRVNLSRVSREETIARLEQEGVKGKLSEISPAGIILEKRVNANSLSVFKEGLVEIQDESSQLVGFVVNPKRDEVIVDACAGSGGKSLELADLSDGLATIYSLDVDSDRLSGLRSRAGRAGFKNIRPVNVKRGSLSGLEAIVSTADKVLVDAPCTGSGTIRRNPDKKFRITTSLVEKMSAYQLEILTHYAKLTRPDGLLIYSTCSIFELENRKVAERFLEANKNYSKIGIGSLELKIDLSGAIVDGNAHTYPHRHGTDGFFIAVMRRVS